MKVVVETSALVGGSVFWEYSNGNETYQVKDKHYRHCSPLFDILRKLSKMEIGIVTKTVENEAKNALNNAVRKTIANYLRYFPDLALKFKVMTLQHIVTNECLNRLERIVEESSVRLPTDIDERERIIRDQLEPFLKETVKNTIRYIQPSIPKFIKGDFRDELSDMMVEALPSKGIVYKGMPEPRDVAIMAEAVMIYRKYDSKEEIYVASKDNHFKPNPVQVGSYHSSKSRFLNEVDPTIRDRIASKFGFIGEDPLQLTEILREKYKGLC
jgi:hypothetical protein